MMEGIDCYRGLRSEACSPGGTRALRFLRKPVQWSSIEDDIDNNTSAVMPSDVRPCPSNNPPTRYFPHGRNPNGVARAICPAGCIVKRRGPSQQ
jgi:hypothetical protein